MKFPKKCKIHKATGHDEHAASRGFDLVRFIRDAKGARLVATSGRIIASVPVEEAEDDTPGLIQASAIEEATKGTRPVEASLIANGQVRVSTAKGFVEMERPADREWPDVTRVIPEGEMKIRVGINPQMLAALASALGADVVVLEFDEESSALRVVPLDRSSDDARVGAMSRISIDG